ncbi:hypothetical protein AB0G04_08670 [Actinoplanes sp. NPDC023801]|uniref:hypothetical protein n=1 Tax=Actinoplanes sp. NPDC023801 TaxID=3154595 RepID=UPI0033E51709
MHFDPGAGIRAMRLTQQGLDSASPKAPTVADRTEPRKKAVAVSRKPAGFWFRILQVLRPAR